MIPSPVPPQLQGLSQAEEMLIACALPIMRVYVEPSQAFWDKGATLVIVLIYLKIYRSLHYHCLDILKTYL